jgi:uncharacterized protein YkwD
LKPQDLLLLIAAVLASASCARAAGSIDAVATDELLAAFNAERSARDGAPLRLSGELSRYAASRAVEVVQKGTLQAPNGHSPIEAARSFGYEAHLLTVVAAIAPGRAAQVVQGWRKADPAAFQEILSPEYADAGVAVAARSPTPVYVVALAKSEADDFRSSTGGLADADSVRHAVIERINGERRGRHMPPLRLEPRLNRAAQDYAQRMLRESFYGHRAPDGSDALTRIRASGYEPRAVGENLAQGQSSVEEALDGWLASPAHRENIFDSDFRDMGLGFAFGKNASGYQVLWVQVFATPRRSPP